MPHIVWSAASLNDLDRIYSFYALKSRTTGLRAILTLQREVNVLDRFPGLGKPAEDPNFRELSVEFGRRAFLVLYEARGPLVTIAAIRHVLEEKYSSGNRE